MRHHRYLLFCVVTAAVLFAAGCSEATITEATTGPEPTATSERAADSDTNPAVAPPSADPIITSSDGPQPTASVPIDDDADEAALDEAEVRASNLGIRRVDLEVMAAAEPAGDGSYQLTAAMRSLDRTSIRRPSLLIEYDSSATLRTNGATCASSGQGRIFCQFTPGTYSQPPENNRVILPTDWMPVTLDVAVTGPTEIAVTAVSDLNGLNGEPLNDPNPDNNTIVVSIDPAAPAE